MSWTWTIYGYSDDCVEIEGDDREELWCIDETAVVECGVVHKFRGNGPVSDEVAKEILGWDDDVDGEFDSRDLDGGAA